MLSVHYLLSPTLTVAFEQPVHCFENFLIVNDTSILRTHNSEEERIRTSGNIHF